MIIVTHLKPKPCINMNFKYLQQTSLPIKHTLFTILQLIDSHFICEHACMPSLRDFVTDLYFDSVEKQNSSDNVSVSCQMFY